MSTRKSTLRLVMVIAGAVLLAAALAGGGLWYWTTIVPDAKAETAQESAQKAELIDAARIAVQARAPQANAITFGKVFVNWIGADPAVCGEVDIQEDQDSQGGPERFVYLQGQLVLEQYEGSDAVAQKWRDVCEG